VSPEEARSRFATAEVARLASVGSDGRPHIVPIVFAVHEQRIYSVVDEKRKRTTALKRLANVRSNPAVAVLADHYERDWSRLWWARADGLARVLDQSAPEASAALRLLAARYPQQRPLGEVLAIDVGHWTGWSAWAEGQGRLPQPERQWPAGPA
jgi:PPOX class probable F420-dependent enzyme